MTLSAICESRIRPPAEREPSTRSAGATSFVTRKNESTRGNVERAVSTRGSITALLPIMAVVLIAFLIIGLALPVLPLHVHQGLGLSTFVVGLVAGSQFAASLVSRVWSGHYADSRGAKRAVVAGLLTAVVAGLLYLLSLGFISCRSASSARPGYLSRYCFSAAPCSVRPRASSSRVRSAGDWLSPVHRTQEES